MKLELDKIRIDGGTQLRYLDTNHVAELRRVHPTNLPKIVVFFDGKDYWLADGFHRYHRFRADNVKSVEVERRKGTQRDAVLYACSANSRHGLPRTNADKRRAVATLLADAEWGKKSSRWIAEKCNVSDDLVADVRKAGESNPVREGKDGKTYRAPETTEKSNNTQGQVSEKAPEPTLIPDDDPIAPEHCPDDEIPTKSEMAATGPVDATGKAIENKSVAAIFERGNELVGLAGTVTKLKSMVARAVESGDELFAEINLSQFEADCNNVYRAIRFAMPHAVCRYCGGDRHKTCKACNGRGWVGEAKFKATPEEMK